MRTLLVQAASRSVLHCYIQGGEPFATTVAARLSTLPGLRGAHLVTAGRAPGKWCLVLEPKLVVEQGNAEALRRLASIVGRRIGCSRLGLVRSVCRPRAEQGPATDAYDWLKW